MLLPLKSNIQLGLNMFAFTESQLKVLQVHLLSWQSIVMLVSFVFITSKLGAWRMPKNGEDSFQNMCVHSSVFKKKKKKGAK